MRCLSLPLLLLVTSAALADEPRWSAEQAPQPLGVEAAGTAQRARCQERRLGAQSDRRVHSGEAGGGEVDAGATGDPRAPDSPRDVRPDRTATDASGDRRICERLLRRKRHMNGSSIGCSRRRTMANAGAGTGSIWPALPRATATNSTSRGPTPGAIAITSSALSMPTSRTIASSRSNSPATSCFRMIRKQSSPRASTCSAPT